MNKTILLGFFIGFLITSCSSTTVELEAEVDLTPREKCMAKAAEVPAYEGGLSFTYEYEAHGKYYLHVYYNEYDYYYDPYLECVVDMKTGEVSTYMLFGERPLYPMEGEGWTIYK